MLAPILPLSGKLCLYDTHSASAAKTRPANSESYEDPPASHEIANGPFSVLRTFSYKQIWSLARVSLIPHELHVSHPKSCQGITALDFSLCGLRVLSDKESS